MITGIVVFVGREDPMRPSNPCGGGGGWTTEISDSPTTLKLLEEQRGHGWVTRFLFSAAITSLIWFLSMDYLVFNPNVKLTGSALLRSPG